MLFGDLLADPAIKAWAIASIVLCLKTLTSGLQTSRFRIQKNIFASPEDYAMQDLEPQTQPDADIERMRRMHLNDLEAAVPFSLIGLVYALTGPSTAGIWICFAGFPIARIAHGISYTNGLMPHRTIFFMAGLLILSWMAVTSLIALIF
jgi:glutathione S-transferase